MAKKKISQLPAGSALNGTELVPIVQTGTTKQITAQDIANLGNASGVEGSGTINRLPKFTASSTIGNSAFFDDGTNQGTETTTAINRFIMSANASIAKIFSFRSGNLPRWAFRVDGTESGANAGADLAIRRYNDAGTYVDSPLFIKRSTGNIGIGTTTPNVELALFNATTPRFHLQNTASGTGTTDGLQLALSGSDAYIWNFENGATIFGTNNTERMRITSAGNVGIGTTAPDSKLKVVNSITDYSPTLILQNTATSDGALVGLRMLPNNGASGLYIGIHSSGFENQNVFINQEKNADLLVLTNSTERMRIKAGGNVLIGTTTDAGYKLDVNGTARLSGELLISTPDDSGMRIKAGATRLSYIDFADANTGTPSGSISYNHTSDYFVISVGGSNAEKMRVKSNTINITNIPTSAVGLSAGDIYSNLGILTIV